MNGYEIGRVADYIAMLAISQTETLDACHALQSITNLMSPECDASVKATAITSGDLAYLRALYSMNPDHSLALQRFEIAHSMRDGLAGR